MWLTQGALVMCCVAKSRHETGCRGHHKLRQSLLTLAKNVLPAKSHVALPSCCRLPEVSGLPR